jgi:putative FmdB family regulatory protein
MPTYEYQSADPPTSCDHCREAFEVFQTLADPRLERCPQCGAPVRKTFSAPAIGRSKSGLDDRAKNAGFTKLKKIGKGEYEKQY